MTKKNTIFTEPVSDDSETNKLIALSRMQAKKQLEAGTASAQVVTHFLKLGSLQAQMELEKQKMEILLITAKIETEKSRDSTESKMNAAIEAFTRYSYNPNSNKE